MDKTIDNYKDAVRMLEKRGHIIFQTQKQTSKQALEEMRGILEDEINWLTKMYDDFDDLYCINEKEWRIRLETLKQKINKIKEVLEQKENGKRNN